jgi:hypothetical protein
MNHIFENTLDEVASKIKNASSIYDLMHLICYPKDNIIVLDYRYFKHIANASSYDFISTYMLNNIDTILINHSKFNAVICIKSLTVGDIEKHMGFIKHISEQLKKKYENKLDKCLIYNAPFIFKQIYNIISSFIDKETQLKIQLVEKK